MAVALAACGGGGGGGSGSGGDAPPASGFQLSFQPGTLNAEYYQGEPPIVSVEVKASQAHAVPVQVAVVDTVGVLGGTANIEARSSLVYTAAMPLSGSLPAGTHSGTIEVRVCEDAPLTCAKPVSGSPWKLPYQIKVRPQSDLKPLSPVAGLTGWTEYLGGPLRNAAKALAVTIGQVGRRWSAPAVQENARSPAVVESGLVITVQRSLSSSAPMLVANREHDGGIAWTRELGGINDRVVSVPTIANGQIYVLGSRPDNVSKVLAWQVDLATGAVRSERIFEGSSYQKTSGLFHGGKLYTCRISEGSGFELIRLDASNLDVDLAYQNANVVLGNTCSTATDGSRVYLLVGSRLVALVPGSNQPVYQVDLEFPQVVSDSTVVLDGAGRGYVAAYDEELPLSGERSLLAFDTNTGRVLWHVRGEFTSMPVVSGGALFVTTGRQVEARSPSDGSLLWRTDTSSPSGLGGVKGALVATNTHLFVASPWTTDAIDLQTRALVWSETKGGPLALSSQATLLIRPHFEGGIRAVNLR